MNKNYINGIISLEEYRQVKDSYKGHLGYGNLIYLYVEYPNFKKLQKKFKSCDILSQEGNYRRLKNNYNFGVVVLHEKILTVQKACLWYFSLERLAKI